MSIQALLQKPIESLGFKLIDVIVAAPSSTRSGLLRVIIDTQDIHRQLQHQNLKQDHRDGRRRGRPQQLRMEVPTEPSQHRGQEDIRDQCHDGNVHVRRVQVIPGRQKHGRVLLLGDLAVRARRRSRDSGLLSRPWLVSPREEDENQLIEDVGIGNVKVVFQRGDRDVAIKLSRQ